MSLGAGWLILDDSEEALISSVCLVAKHRDESFMEWREGLRIGNGKGLHHGE